MKGTLHNLESSEFVAGHGSVTGSQVANALVAAMVATEL